MLTKNEIALGIYDNIPYRKYQELPYVSNSYLGRLASCPAKALVPREDTPALIFGRAVHCYILEGKRTFNKEFVIAPDIDKRTKDGKEEWDTFLKKAKDKTIISSTDFKTICDMKDSILKHPFAPILLKEGVSEQTVIWRDDETEIICKCRPDRVPSGDKGVLVDLKTTNDASEKAFTHAVINYGYARQAAFYMDGITKATGMTFDAFVFIVVEKEPPYRVEVYELDMEFIGWGYEKYKELLRLEKQCRQNGRYPHYQNAGASVIYKPNYLI